MENTRRVPFFIPVAAIVIVALMFVYAAFFDHSFPEKAVKGFYQAYFDQDYQGAAENLSASLAAKLVPELGATEEQAADREAITAALADVLSSAAADAPSAEGMKVTILKHGIVKGKTTAMVAFSIADGSDEAEGTTAVALLLKEGNAYKLVDACAISPEYADQIASADLSMWDEYFGN